MTMKNAAAFLVIVMISSAASIPCLAVARSSPNCSPPKIPGTTPAIGTCPLNALKLGACVDLLGRLAHVVLGDPVVNQCCPVLQGVLEVEAALCLCTTIRIKLPRVNIILPVALELFVQCGMNPAPGFTCPPLS